MEKYEVVHIIDSFATGGLEKQVFNMLCYGKINAYVICLSKDGHFGEELLSRGKKVVYLTSNSVQGRLWQVYQVFKNNPAAIIHGHNQKSYFYGAIIGRLFPNVKVLMSKHGETFTSSKLFNAVTNFFLKKDPIIAVSDKIKWMCHRKFSGELSRITVVANGSSFEEYRQKKNKNDESINIGAVGRLVTVKNYALLINAFAILAKQYKHLKLTIVGDGPERENLEKLVIKHGIKDKVEFAGLQQNVTKFLQEMDLFVISSDSEGLPLALLEAASNSLPIVSTRVGAIPDVLQHRHSAMLSPPGNMTGLLENLQACVEDSALRNLLAKNAYQQLESIYSIDVSIEAHGQIYEQIKHP